MPEEGMARYIEMHHILLCRDFNSRTGQAPDYEGGVIDTSANIPNQPSNEDTIHSVTNTVSFYYFFV